MKRLLLMVLCVSSSALADTHYVDINSSSPAAPYTNWNTAANFINPAISETVDGDVILVADGIYLEPEIVVNKAISIQSVNGPALAIIDPGGAHRAFELDHPDAVISGITIKNGNASGSEGGGVRCQYDTCIITNCVIRECSATMAGGVHGGTVLNCKLIANIAQLLGGGMEGGTVKNSLFRYNHAGDFGGGIQYSLAYNCTIIENSCGVDGGGAEISTVYNSIVYNNIKLEGNVPNDFNGGAGYYSCSPDLTPGTDGNITNAPLFINQASGNFHLSTNSPCADAGLSAYAVSLPADLDGNTRIVNARVDMGAYEIQPPWSGSYMSVKATLEKSLDLQTWTNLGQEVEWLVPIDSSNQFYRAKLEI